MKITAVKLYTMHIPLITPFKTALRTVDAIDDLIVVLETDDGQRGFGEAPPTAVITGDTIPSVAGEGCECMMGCMLEGNVAVTAAAHAAMARGSVTRIDLDGPALCTENPVHGGAQFNGSRITLPDAPGLGITDIDGLVPFSL